MSRFYSHLKSHIRNQTGILLHASEILKGGIDADRCCLTKEPLNTQTDRSPTHTLFLSGGRMRWAEFMTVNVGRSSLGGVAFMSLKQQAGRGSRRGGEAFLSTGRLSPCLMTLLNKNPKSFDWLSVRITMETCKDLLVSLWSELNLEGFFRTFPVRKYKLQLRSCWWVSWGLPSAAGGAVVFLVEAAVGP